MHWCLDHFPPIDLHTIEFNRQRQRGKKTQKKKRWLYTNIYNTHTSRDRVEKDSLGSSATHVFSLWGIETLGDKAKDLPVCLIDMSTNCFVTDIDPEFSAIFFSSRLFASRRRRRRRKGIERNKRTPADPYRFSPLTVAFARRSDDEAFSPDRDREKSVASHVSSANCVPCTWPHLDRRCSCFDSWGWLGTDISTPTSTSWKQQRRIYSCERSTKFCSAGNDWKRYDVFSSRFGWRPMPLIGDDEQSKAALVYSGRHHIQSRFSTKGSLLSHRHAYRSFFSPFSLSFLSRRIFFSICLDVRSIDIFTTWRISSDDIWTRDASFLSGEMCVQSKRN